eukprot:COSAG01_NODE_14348_length_1465_cov_2.614202_1_plen_135_part_10
MRLEVVGEGRGEVVANHSRLGGGRNLTYRLDGESKQSLRRVSSTSAKLRVPDWSVIQEFVSTMLATEMAARATVPQPEPEPEPEPDQASNVDKEVAVALSQGQKTAALAALESADREVRLIRYRRASAVEVMVRG